MAEYNFSYLSLMFDYIKNDIKKNEDGLVVLLHWLLLKNRFQVLGPGNEKEIGENEQPSDILPINWSQNEIFKIRYVHNNKLFLLNGVNTGSGFIFNLYNVTKNHVTSASFKDIKDITMVEWIKDMANNKDNIRAAIDLLQKDLINPIKDDDDNKKNSSTQTHDNSTYGKDYKGQLVTTPSRSMSRIAQNPFPFYGMPDLDPLGGLRDPGVGMIYEPPRPDRPPGRLPMPRFDPVRPDFPNSYRRPNPDHMRPPDFDDNLYM